MLRILTDENLREEYVTAMRAHVPPIDVATAREVGLLSRSDEAVLEFAANSGRVVLTHDENTLVGLAWARVRRGLAMPGVIVVHWSYARRSTPEEVVIAAAASSRDELRDQVRYLPL